MKLTRTVILVFMVCGFCFAQGKISPVIAMAWDWDNVANTTTAGERIGIEAAVDGDRSYGIDTNGTDHRTYFAYKYSKLGIGVIGTKTLYTIGATYNVIGGVRTELEYVGSTDTTVNPFLRLSLVATF